MHQMFKEDAKTGVPKKLSRKKLQIKKDFESEKKPKAKPQIGKMTCGKPNRTQARGITLKIEDKKGTETEPSSSDG